MKRSVPFGQKCEVISLSPNPKQQIIWENVNKVDKVDETKLLLSIQAYLSISFEVRRSNQPSETTSTVIRTEYAKID